METLTAFLGEAVSAATDTSRSFLDQLATWIGPILGVAGVAIGARMAARSGEKSWLRERRTERYEVFMKKLADGSFAIDDVLTVLSQPSDYTSREEWDAAITAAGERVGAASLEIRDAVTEFGLLAGPRVVTSARDVLTLLAELSRGACRR
jgi:hypothetical protein